ncbi:MAG: ATP-binding protein [Acidobacteriota bacterium]|jgi:predicted AAA+ superfamily ATPase|nr:ATP-binding protein [Acidobacteriota bacterium]
MRRLQKDYILRDLENNKMAIIVGPRQVGKTWLAREISKSFNHPVYLNYDSLTDRRHIKSEDWLSETDLLIFDEIHKMKHWKNYLKGIFDTKPEHQRIIVTGSARLDAFRRGGDSMAGRFFVHYLLPFSIRELSNTPFADQLSRLINRGGFPEPFLADDDAFPARWRNQYKDGLIREDILDFEAIHQLRTMEILLETLRERVGSPLSYKSLAEDLEVSPNTVKKYVRILESLFIVFLVHPYATNIARSILKEPKLYFFDTGMVKGDTGIRFENMVALALLKHVTALADYRGESAGLHYLRTKDGREVDFCLVRNNKVEQIIECKLTSTKLDRNLVYFADRYNLPAVQLVHSLRTGHQSGAIEILPALKYLNDLYL